MPRRTTSVPDTANCWGQFSFFLEEPSRRITATNLFDNKSVSVEPVTSWMLHLVPNGKFTVMVGTHPMVLRPMKLKESKIPKGHEYYHYVIDDVVYSGIFVGIE